MTRVTILGCGHSGGTPLIGCECSICKSDNPKNQRSRASIWLQSDTTSALVDSSPDLRRQALNNQLTHLDAVVYTHAHADHTHGIDDLRSFNYRANAALPIYADEATLASLRKRFSYAFGENPDPLWYRPCLLANTIKMDPPEKFFVGDIEFQPFWQHHGWGETLGFRVGNFAYSTDVKDFPEQSLVALDGLDVWLVDCLRYIESSSHAHLDLTLSWIKRFKPKRAILTHMSHEIDYDDLRKRLPDNVEPAYDGMVLHL